MVGMTGSVPEASRIIFSDEAPAGSFGGMVFGFFEEGEDHKGGCLGSCSSEENASVYSFEDEDQLPNELAEEAAEIKRAYWEDKHQLLQATLCRTTSLESAIRRAVKAALSESQLICICKTPVAGGGCRSCLLREISNHLQNAGFNSAICKSKWRRSSEIPSGEHTYVDVVEKAREKKGEVRVIVELNFRAEFEMARASEEYNKLIKQLPELFVGKAERLLTVIKIMCSAAKKCMKEKKMHMGPWRKQKYMQAKWFGICERTVLAVSSSSSASSSSSSMQFSTGFAQQPHHPLKPKASMLTIDLLEMLPSFQHFTAVEVV